MVSNIKKIITSKETQPIIGNVISLGLNTLVNIIVPIFLIPYLISNVGVENYGKYAFVFAFIFYFLYISQFGFGLSAVRDIAKNKNDYLKINDIFNKVLSTKLIILLICFIIVLIVTYLVNPLYNELFLVFSTFFIVVGDVLNPIWFYQGIEKMRFVTIVNVVSKLTFVLFVVLFVNSPSDYKIIGLCQAIGYLLAGIISLWYAVKKFNLKISSVSLSDVVKQIKYSASSFITLVLPMLYVNTSSFILGITGNLKHVTYFDTAYKISNGFVNLNSILTNVFYPFVNRRQDVFKYVAMLLILSGAIMSILSFFLAKYIIDILFGNDMQPSILPLQILCMSPLFLSIRSAFGVNYLLVVGKDKLYMKIAMFSSLFSFAVGLFLIYNYNSIGAAIVVVLAQGIYSLLSMYFALKVIKNAEKC